MGGVRASGRRRRRHRRRCRHRCRNATTFENVRKEQPDNHIKRTFATVAGCNPQTVGKFCPQVQQSQIFYTFH